MDELLDGFLDHWPAPDDWLIAIEQETHAHEFHAIILRRHELLVGTDRGTLPDAHHERNARAINCAIEQADALAQMLKRAGEVHRTSGFAHAAFAARDRNDALDASNFIRLCGARRLRAC